MKHFTLHVRLITKAFLHEVSLYNSYENAADWLLTARVYHHEEVTCGVQYGVQYIVADAVAADVARTVMLVMSFGVTRSCVAMFSKVFSKVEFSKVDRLFSKIDVSADASYCQVVVVLSSCCINVLCRVLRC